MSERKPKDYGKTRGVRGAGEVPAEPEGASPEEGRGVSRREFLAAAGFTLAGAVVAGCARAPVEKAIPYLVQPEHIVPGRAYHYASTCGGCASSCGVVVKNRDGRPIKVEGNAEHPLSRGGLCAVGQATVLGLYDSHRLASPLAGGRETTWAAVDRAVGERLAAIRAEGGAVRFLSGTEASPTARAEIERFLAGFASGRHVEYDTLSSAAILDAHERTHGARLLPRYHLDRSEVIVGVDADFLGTWISPVEYTAGYRAGRTLEGRPPRLSYHVQFESRMSLTGSNADVRYAVRPGDLGVVMDGLARRLAARAGVVVPGEGGGAEPFPAETLDRLAERLWRARGRSLVLCGSQEIQTQLRCNFVNHLLGNYGATLEVARPSFQRRGSDRALEELQRELNRGEVAALFVRDVDPVYDLPDGETWARAMKEVALTVSFAASVDETASVSAYVCPDHHYLEAWRDAEPAAGVFGLTQPALSPLGGTRAMIESLAVWRGEAKAAYDLIREHWEARVYPLAVPERTFRTFWERAVHDGYVEVATEAVAGGEFDMSAVRPGYEAPAAAEGAFALVLYPKVAIVDGHHASNPWLQELPDPVTKAVWDNYACLSPRAAAAQGLAEGDVVRVEAPGGVTAEFPVLVQPGQHDGVVAVALGYGRRETGRFAGIGPRWLEGRPTVEEGGVVGTRAAPFLAWENGTRRYLREGVKVVKTGKRHDLAITQGHHSLSVPPELATPGAETRPIVQETTLPAFVGNPAAGGHPHHNPAPGSREDLWPDDHKYPGHHWGIVVDLNACTGCSACVVSCQAENNLPVVGKDEVRRSREMHWLRIDRYYAGPEAAPTVVHQPMFCQHCDYAPCETVCPVLATVHSREGLSEQVYNRCVGTRFCEANCPYKVRRFNWFHYRRDDERENLVLNPDVVVRSRGVMEKCTFCVQRIQEAKIEAKRQGRAPEEGDIRTACQQSCPAGAIVFGDLNDPRSRVSRLAADPRRYDVLAELNLRPSVGYLRLVRNTA